MLCQLSPPLNLMIFRHTMLRQLYYDAGHISLIRDAAYCRHADISPPLLMPRYADAAACQPRRCRYITPQIFATPLIQLRR